MVPVLSVQVKISLPDVVEAATGLLTFETTPLLRTTHGSLGVGAAAVVAWVPRATTASQSHMGGLTSNQGRDRGSGSVACELYGRLSLTLAAPYRREAGPAGPG